MTLNTQYRMLPPIGQLVSEVFYGDIGGLEHGRETPIDPRVQAYAGEIRVKLIDIPGHEEAGPDGRSKQRGSEVQYIRRELKALQHHAEHTAPAPNGPERLGVALITPYMAQSKELRKHIDLTNYPDLAVRVGIVDSFQGDEDQVVILSIAGYRSRVPLEAEPDQRRRQPRPGPADHHNRATPRDTRPHRQTARERHQVHRPAGQTGRPRLPDPTPTTTQTQQLRETAEMTVLCSIPVQIPVHRIRVTAKCLATGGPVHTATLRLMDYWGESPEEIAEVLGLRIPYVQELIGQLEQGGEPVEREFVLWVDNARGRILPHTALTGVAVKPIRGGPHTFPVEPPLSADMLTPMGLQAGLSWDLGLEGYVEVTRHNRGHR